MINDLMLKIKQKKKCQSRRNRIGDGINFPCSFVVRIGGSDCPTALALALAKVRRDAHASTYIRLGIEGGLYMS